MTRQELYCQWLTAPSIAAAFLDWCHVGDNDSVLEPAAGEGALVPEGHSRVTAYEIDHERASELQRHRPLARVVCEDFLAQPAPDEPVFDVCVTNPPYSGNGEGVFIERGVRWARRVCALVRLEAFHGSTRYEACWSRVSLRRVAFLVHRPRFLGPFGAATGYSPKYAYVAVEATALDSHAGSPEVSWVTWR